MTAAPADGDSEMWCWVNVDVETRSDRVPTSVLHSSRRFYMFSMLSFSKSADLLRESGCCSACYEWKHGCFYFVLPFLSFSFITYLNGGAAVLFDSQNPTGAAERTFCFSGGVAALTGSPLPFTTEQGGCLCTSLLHYLLIFSLTLAFLSNMYYYFFGGLLAALVLQALQNKCDASEGGAAAGFHGKYDPIFEKIKYYLCRALVIFRTLQNVFFTADETAQRIWCSSLDSVKH